VGAELLGLLHDAGVRLQPARADDLGDLRDLAAHHALEAGPEPAQEAERMHAVADHQLAGREAFEREAVDFIARKSGHDRRHGTDPWVAWPGWPMRPK
jgi:hypothetical protein